MAKAGAKARKRMKRLERELAGLRATEDKRLEQLKQVRAKAIDVGTRLSELRMMVSEAAGSEAASAGPLGWCMREKRRVQIDHPRPVTLSNGRVAIAGTCSTCRARVMSFSVTAAPAGT